MIGVGVLGWLMKKLEFNPADFVIAFVLAGGAEETFRQSLLLSDNGLLIFVTCPVALGFLLLGVVTVALRARALSCEARAVSLEGA